jgi:hypothetical protein
MNQLGEHFYNPKTKELIDVNVTGGGDHAIAAGILTVKDFKDKFMPVIDAHIKEATTAELKKIDDLKKVGWIFPETVSFIEKFEPNIRKWPLYDFYSKNSTLQSNKFDKIADAVKKLGFILTRNQNVEIANWGPDKKKQLAECINKIKDDPKYMNNEKEFDDMDINIFDYSTKRNWKEKVKDILYDSFSIKSDTNSDAKEIRGRYYQSPFSSVRGNLRAFQQKFTSESIMNFKLWLEEENPEYNYPKNISPRNLLGSGKFASVYETNHSDVVMRVEPLKKDLSNIAPQFHDQSCEKFMMKPEIQATGGVAKIYNTQITEYDFQDEKNPLFITYKEKIDTNWIPYFEQKYKNESDVLIKQFSTGIFAGPKNKDKMIEILENFPETKKLAKAIRLGLPTEDLSTTNVGFNKKGQLVAIDC